MTQIKLTIGIPTFNGAKHIEQTIDSVLSQLEDIDPSIIEILISDNSSEDHVWQIATSYKEKFPTIFSIFRNEVNVGYDRNIDLIFKRANGLYVWTLADDDIVSPDAIKQILTILTLHSEVNLLFVGGIPNLIGQKDNFICKDGNAFFSKTGFRNGGVSSNILKKSAWNSVNVATYFDTGWIHFGVVLEVASNSASYVFREALESEIPGVSKKWGLNGTHLLVGLDLVQIFQGMGRLGYDEECIRKAHWLIKCNYHRKICKAKAEGLTVDFILIRRFIKLYNGFPSFWLIDLPLLLMPQKLSWLLYQGYRLIRSSSTVVIRKKYD
jgi:glycosyltransferase involved in cell wall biosynthesis